MDSYTDGDRAFRATLTTCGRVTGRPHSVALRAVSHSGRIYFSRHLPDSDWYLNAAANPAVSVGFPDGSSAAGHASTISDSELLHIISEIKYPGQQRAKERRVAIEVSIK